MREIKTAWLVVTVKLFSNNVDGAVVRLCFGVLWCFLSEALFVWIVMKDCELRVRDYAAKK